LLTTELLHQISTRKAKGKKRTETILEKAYLRSPKTGNQERQNKALFLTP
jgi:hypothetical protein